MFARFPEVTKVVSQVGRPDDGTDYTGFFNTEYFIDLRPKEQWRAMFHQDKEQLIAALGKEVEKIPGVVWNFSQPIADNMEEAVSGVKGELAVKIYGADLKLLEDKADEIMAVMSKIRGVQDLGIFRVIGQPNLNLTVNRDKAARFGINVSDVQDAIETAAGGKAVSSVLKGEERYDLVVRYQPQYRTTIEADREHSAAGAFGRARLDRPALRCGDPRRRFRNLSRGQPALRGHQVRRSRARPGQHGGGSHRIGDKSR